MKKATMLLFLVFFAFSTAAVAAEVKNIKVGQSGDKAVATYDLVGRKGEREAEVIVTITIDGVRRKAEWLELSGDFGIGVKVGPRKKIIWNAVADLPANFDGELSWDIQVASDSATSQPEEKKTVKKLAKKGKKVLEKADNKEDSPEDSKISESITFNAKNGNVNFSHKEHSERLKGCDLCHPNGLGKILNFGKEVAHKSCKGCHKNMHSGPIKCGECHKKENYAVQAARQDVSYPNETTESADYITLNARNGNVTFSHKGHIEKQKDCNVCHPNGPGKILNFGKDMAHKVCKGCHENMHYGPTKCGECHKK